VQQENVQEKEEEHIVVQRLILGGVRRILLTKKGYNMGPLLLLEQDVGLRDPSKLLTWSIFYWPGEG